MSSYTYALDPGSYTWKNALFWGNVGGHYKKACEGDHWFGHTVIAIIETIPVIGAIIAIFEKLIVVGFKTPECPARSSEQRSVPPGEPRRQPTITSPVVTKPLVEWNREDVVKLHQDLQSKFFINLNSNESSKPPLFISKSPLFTWSRWSDGTIMPSMEGLEHLASYLSTKHSLPKENFIVCKTLNDLQEELVKFQKNVAEKGTFKRAFVVGTHSSQWWGQAQDGTIPSRTAAFAQHIFTIGVEIRDKSMHVVLLEPMQRNGNQTIDSRNIGLEPFYDSKPHTEQERVLSHIFNRGAVDLNKATIYHLEENRELFNGCWVFALKDAVTFLKTPDFFRSESIPSISIKGRNLRKIPKLPIQFMMIAQNNGEEFEKYLKDHPNESLAIRAKITKHQVNGQNLRVGHASVKWMKLLEQAASKAIA